MNRLMMLMLKHTTRLIVLWLIGYAAAVAAAQSQLPSGLEDGWPLVVHFEKNQARLGQDDRLRIRQVFGQVALPGQGRVFVVGYADSSGKTARNEKLALKRARVVRNTLLKELGLAAEQVIAIGQGARNPVADNRRKDGRAKNRRAEIYLADPPVPMQTTPAMTETNLAAINTLLSETRDLVRRDRWDAALEKLDQARSLGGSYIGDWHALYGIIGFFKGASADRVRTHLEAALAYDAANADARDFLSRVEARENVSGGLVTADMGRSPQAPIMVGTMSQQYEYLSLFGAIPRYHHRLDHLPVDVWECLDRQGEPVVYYFDHSGIYAWAFNKTGEFAGECSGSRDSNNRSQRPVSNLQSSVADKSLSAPRAVPVNVSSGALGTPQTIWESELFR